MQKYYIALLTIFLTVISHAGNTLEASVTALPPAAFLWDQPVRAFALIVGILAVTITLQQAVFRKKSRKLSRFGGLND